MELLAQNLEKQELEAVMDPETQKMNLGLLDSKLKNTR